MRAHLGPRCLFNIIPPPQSPVLSPSPSLPELLILLETWLMTSGWVRGPCASWPNCWEGEWVQCSLKLGHLNMCQESCWQKGPQDPRWELGKASQDKLEVLSPFPQAFCQPLGDSSLLNMGWQPPPLSGQRVQRLSLGSKTLCFFDPSTPASPQHSQAPGNPELGSLALAALKGP